MERYFKLKKVMFRIYINIVNVKQSIPFKMFDKEIHFNPIKL